MANIFISSASPDSDIARTVCRWLDADNHDVFFYEHPEAGIQPGEEWERRLYTQLDAADAVVCIVTAAFIDSKWCFMEVGISKGRGNKIFPLRTAPDLQHPLLDSFQYWDFDPYDESSFNHLRVVLRRLHRAGGAGWDGTRSPFPGLRAFDSTMRAVYFGREEEMRELVRMLCAWNGDRAHRPLMVLGPSGCGKSSLVQAGLVPRIRDDPSWLVVEPFRPGNAPVDAFAAAIAGTAAELGLSWSASQLLTTLDSPLSAMEIADNLLRTAGTTQRRILLVVDQLEEILTSADEISRKRFFKLVPLGPVSPIRIVSTLRSEYLAELMQCSDAAAWAKHPFPLCPMKREVFPSIIEKPARVARIHVDRELVAGLIADVPTADSLPLLAFVLEQIAAGVTRGGTLSYELYERLGGVRGALSKQAETALTEALSAVSSAERNNTHLSDEMIAALLRLVEIDSAGITSRRWIDWEELSTPEKTLLEHFIKHRLLTTSEHVGRIQVGVAHEAFLTSWEPLKRAISDTKSAISTRSMVEQAAREWEQSGRNPAYLLSHSKIVTVETNLAQTAGSARRVGRWNFSNAGRLITALVRSNTYTRTDEHRIAISGVGLGKIAKEYLDRSRRSARRRRGLLATAALALSILITLVSSIAYLQQQTAHERQRTAAATRLVAQANAIRDTDPLLAIRLATAAEQVSPGPETKASLINILGATRYKGTIIEGPGQMRAARYSTNGQVLVITGKLDAMLVDLRGVTPIEHTLPETSRASAVDLSPNGKLLAIGTETSSLALWNIANPASPLKIGAVLSEKDGVSALTFSPDSRTLVVGGGGDKPTPSIWDVSDVDRPHRLTFHDGEAVPVYSLAFSPDGQTLAVGLNGRVALWTVTEGRRLIPQSTPLSGFEGIVHSVTFSPDGKMLAAGGFDGQVLLWRVDNDDGLTPLAPIGDGSPVNDVTFSPDARTLAAGKEDGDIRLWDLSDPDHPSPLNAQIHGHSGPVQSVDFSPDGATLVSAGDDGRVMLWDLLERGRTPRQLGETHPFPANGFSSLAISFDGSILAAGSADGVVSIWKTSERYDLPTPLPPIRLRDAEPISSVAFSPREQVLAVGSTNNTISLWKLSLNEAPRPLTVLTGPTAPISSVAFSIDGLLLAAGSTDTTVTVWNIEDPTSPRQIGQPLTTSERISSVAWAPDQNVLAAAGRDRKVYRWSFVDVENPITIESPLFGPTKPINTIAFSPDGRTLAAGSDDSGVWVWDVFSGGESPAGRRLSGPGSPVNSVAFAPDNSSVAGGSNDFNVTIWDLADPTDPQLLGQPLSAPLRPVRTITYSRDGKTIIAGSDDRSIVLWDVSPLVALKANFLEYACDRTGGGLSSNEWDRFVPGIPYLNNCT